MRKYKFGIGLLFTWAVIGLAAGQFDRISTTPKRSIFGNWKTTFKNRTPIHKALLTQRGYIQFLRWELPVPEIEEFTFCLWVKSVNLTLAHSIFSYSKHEKDRLIRSWISPFGRSVHLAIGEMELLAHPAKIEEHRWYHICQSWDNRLGGYALWMDGRKEAEGRAKQLIGHVIPSGGDIVVGQEYTDFDRGLEEGIEGAVLGFNFLLSSAFADFYPKYSEIPRGNEESLFGLKTNVNELRFGSSFQRDLPNYGSIERDFRKRQTVLGYANRQTLRGNADRLTLRGHGDRRLLTFRVARKRNTDLGLANESTQRRILTNRDRQQPLGLQLIEMSYSRCEIGRGSPYVGGPKMLISWTRTPVRVFGGAILKNAKWECGNF